MEGFLKQSPSQEERAKKQASLLRPPSTALYDTVRTEGEEELRRPVSSLWWSGLAGGLAISMSLVGQGVLRQAFGDVPGLAALESLGYATGFLIVVFGRLQLFTENTVTAVLPVMSEFTRPKIWQLLRLWAVVLAANLAGTFIFALSAAHLGLFPADQVAAFEAISRHFLAKTPFEMMLHAVPAGFLIAAMVWTIPLAQAAKFWMVIFLTTMIALGDLTHVVVGSAEAFLLMVSGEIGPMAVALEFFLPALFGNIVGGTALFALLAYAQVREEL